MRTVSCLSTTPESSEYLITYIRWGLNSLSITNKYSFYFVVHGDVDPDFFEITFPIKMFSIIINPRILSGYLNKTMEKGQE